METIKRLFAGAWITAVLGFALWAILADQIEKLGIVVVITKLIIAAIVLAAWLTITVTAVNVLTKPDGKKL